MEEEQVPIQQDVHGDQNAVSIYGNATVQHIHEPPLPSDLPERVWMVPYRRNSWFTGRETLLRALHERFTTDRTAVLTQGQAISGLGGIGKTQVAVEYAYRHREAYRFVLWINASTPETLLTSYVSMADQLHLPERSVKEQDKIVAAVFHWLSTHEDWLLIVDNADDLESVWSRLPTGSTGHVLLTTRDQLVGDMESFQVEQMEQNEGTLLLLRRARLLKAGMTVEQISQTDRAVAEQIVAEMDGLPLALDQAGAYLEEIQCSLQTYLQRYQAQRTLLLGRRGRGSREYPASVRTIWSLSFEQVEQKSPAAADLLRVCAFLAPDAIPEEIVTQGASHLGEQLQAVLEDQGQLDEAIGVLKAYSLIRRDTEGNTLSIHRLVQTVLRDSMDKITMRCWIERTIRAVHAILLPLAHTDWSQWERLLAHTQMCAEHIVQQEIYFSEATRLLQRTGWYLVERARYHEAESLLTRAYIISEQVQGPEHIETARDMDTLACLYVKQGRYSEAEPLYQRALVIFEQQWGSEDTKTAQSLNNLALLYVHQSRYGEAEPLYQRALSIRMLQLGLEHLDTAHSLDSLAGLYESQGKYTEAQPLYQYALTIREQQLGPKHPDTAHSLNNLAYLYVSQGRYGEAEPLYQRALVISEQQVGLEHPRTATSLNNLGFLYKNQGRYEEAEPLLQHALAIREQQLGPEHPDTATSLNNLALLYKSQGKYREVEPLLQRALAIREQQLGPEHPDTAASLNNLALLYRSQGKYTEAQPLSLRALAISEQQLGPEHPKTAIQLNNLALLYKSQGKYTEAEPLYQRALAISEQYKGPEHPLTATRLHNLASLYIPKFCPN